MSKQQKHFVTCENGEQISLYEAAKIIERNSTTTRDWFMSGLRTLSQLKHKASISVPGSRCKRHMTPRGELTIIEISKIADVTIDCIKHRIKARGINCPSLFWNRMQPAEFRKRLIKGGLEPEGTKVTREPKITVVDEENDRFISIPKLAEMLKLDKSKAYNFVTIIKCKTVNDVKARIEWLKRNKYGGSRDNKFIVPSSVNGISFGKCKGEFSYVNFCNRTQKDGMVIEKCINFSLCQQTRAFEGEHGKHHIEDGSCYSGAKLECWGTMLGGQITDRRGAISE